MLLQNQYALSMLQDLARGSVYNGIQAGQIWGADPRNNALKSGVQMIGGFSIRGAANLLLMRITSNYYFFFASPLTSMFVAFI